jgi:hypothetical protein
MIYRSRWRIALEQLDRAAANGLQFDALEFDEYAGGKPGFLRGLDEPGQSFVAELPMRFHVLAKRPRGRRPNRGWTGKRVDNLARHSADWHRQEWLGAKLARPTLDDEVREVRAAQVRRIRDGDLTDRTYWLTVARPPGAVEYKYFLSNVAADESLERLLRIPFSRWSI